MKIEQLQINQIPELKEKKDVKGYEKAAKEFEAYFVSYLLKKMRDTVPKSGLMDPGAGGEIYTSLMDEKVAEGIAGSGGRGSTPHTGEIGVMQGVGEKRKYM